MKKVGMDDILLDSGKKLANLYEKDLGGS